jgi:energy-converting hydrogenase Eha subunit A
VKIALIVAACVLGLAVFVILWLGDCRVSLALMGVAAGVLGAIVSELLRWSDR